MPPRDGQRTAGSKSMGIPLPEKCISPRYDLDLWPLTLIFFSNVHSNDEYLWQVSLKSVLEIASLRTEISHERSREIGVDRRDNGRTVGRTTRVHNASAAYCWRRPKITCTILDALGHALSINQARTTKIEGKLFQSCPSL